MRHLRHAARSLLGAPAFTSAVVASLGISIAAIATVWSVADAVLFRPLPYGHADRLVWITSVRPQRADAPFSLPELMDYADRARTVDIAAFASWNASLATAGVARRLDGMRISGNAFDVLGASPSAGRLLRAADDRPDAPRVVLLSHAFWTSEFGADRGVVGRTLRLNDQPYQVVGVLPRRFPLHVLRHVDVIVPLSPDLDPRRHVRTSTNFLRLFGRTRGAGTAAAAQELSAIASELRAGFPSEYADKLGVAVAPLQEFMVGNTRRTFVVMLGAAGLLLAIAFANVLNLLLVRAVAKRGEIALRRALGGSGRQLALGPVSEAALLALAGAAAGAIMAKWLVTLVASSSLAVPRLDEARLAGRTVVFVAAIAVLGTLLFSAIQLVAASRAAPQQALSAIGRGLGRARGEVRVRAGLLVAQLGLAMLLTVVTVTMARSLARLQSVALGFRPDSVFVARLALPAQRYQSVADLARFADELEPALRAQPGVVAAGTISVAPLSGILRMVPFTVAGRPPARVRDRPDANLRAVSSGYLAAVGATILRGRDFTPADRGDAAKAAIVSRALAERHFGGLDPLGQQLLLDDNEAGPRPVTIVGVVENMRHVSLDGPAEVDVYVPLAQSHPDGVGFLAASQFWMVRLTPGTRGYAQTFSRTLQAIDRDVAIALPQSMSAYVDASLAPRRFSVLALFGFAAVAMVLALVGVHGLVAYSVAQRRREIGLRLALGATAVGIAGSLVGRTLGLAACGVAIGVGGALLSKPLVSNLLFGVAPSEPAIVVAVACLLIAASAGAAALAARRATGIDPTVALGERNSSRVRRGATAVVALAVLALTNGCAEHGSPAKSVIRVAEIGHVVVGGATISVRDARPRQRVRAASLPLAIVEANGDFTPGATYVRFVKLAAPRHQLPLLLLPGGGLSGAVYETTPDGRPGWEPYFLRAGYSVFTADLQQTGRSPWSRYPEINPDEPAFRDRAFLWEVFRIGPPGSYAGGMRPFDGTQFPVAAFDAFAKLAAPRFSSPPEVEAATNDAIIQRVCPCILLSHSASSGPALAAAQRRPDLVRAVIAVEPSRVPGETPHQGPPALVVWGDFLAADQTQPSWAEQVLASRRFVDGALRPGDAMFLDLPALGIRGNSHMLMSDLNSDQVAARIERWIRERGL
ncbi:MAG TPA: ADOP family duplicated permease [Thermoanaerobaculia bacterium]|nr:ADOP family duplicated permease [Thermoanaerobaculia bacterium]